MSNSDYYNILRKIEFLRNKGKSDSDLELIKAKLKLRECLDKKLDKTSYKGPRLTSVRTFKLKPLGNIGTVRSVIKSNKYVITGMAIALFGVGWMIRSKFK